MVWFTHVFLEVDSVVFHKKICSTGVMPETQILFLVDHHSCSKQLSTWQGIQVKRDTNTKPAQCKVILTDKR